ncbi:MAG: hypothetical protein IT308_12935 [Anaerolineaceae bacterium]|nr:hypothetical protein [Anaerolineaceae bacterium]
METPTPVQTVAPTPTTQVVVSGDITLSPGEVLDLDSGALLVEEGDISFEINGESGQFLVPVNQASLGFFGKSRPAEWECRLASLSSAPLALNNFAEGGYICFRSSKGLPGYALIGVKRLKENQLDIKYATWFIP